MARRAARALPRRRQGVSRARGLHDLRTRKQRHRTLRAVPCLGAAPTGPSRKRTTVSTRVEERLQERFPGTEILIHVDPEGQTDRETLLSSEITENAQLTCFPSSRSMPSPTRPLTGNPAAVIPLERWLDDAPMQAIAGENNLSETAFTVPSESDDADYDLRWFTPAAEVELCGHATLAAGHVLIHSDPVVFRRSRES